MSNIEKNIQEEEIFIVGALDSLGVPYTIDNKELKSFIELTVDILIQEKINLKYINLCSLGRNKTWELEKILKRNDTIENYIKQNKLASKYVISGQRKEEQWNFPTNPNFIEDYYKLPPYSNIKITDTLINAKHPIFLYSCGGMNIRSYLKIRTEMTPSVVLDITKEVLFRAKRHIIQTKQDIDHCLSYIDSLNPNIEIYVLGIYAMLDNPFLRDIVTPLVFWYNQQLKQVLKKHPNAHYVEIKNVRNMVAVKDMHPTLEGQKYIASQVIKVMEKEYQKKWNARKEIK